MALEDKVPLSIVDLNSNCLFGIFSHLKLFDVLNFRFQCSTLNKIVLQYLFSTIKISILYTENEDPETRLSPTSKRRRVRYPSLLGSPILTSRDLLDQTLDDCSPKPHFRNEDFIVISGMQKYAMFSRFVEKYIPNITKLALVIDPEPNEFPLILETCPLLKAFPKVETLFLERIYRVVNQVSSLSDVQGSSRTAIDRLFNQNRDVNQVPNLSVFQEPSGMAIPRLFNQNPIQDPNPKPAFKMSNLGRLLVAIAALPKLCELHFFARQTSKISLTASTSNDLAQTMIGHFLLRMINKLRIFRMNHFRDQPHYRFLQDPLLIQRSFYLDPLLGRTFDDILELGFEAEDCVRLTNTGTVFKRLQTLTLFRVQTNEQMIDPFTLFDAHSFGNSFQQLKTLQFDRILTLSDGIMHNLNALPNLEKLTAKGIQVPSWFELEEILVDDDYEYVNINKTIKHIQVEKVNRRSTNLIIYAFTDFFQSLLSVTVSLPEVAVCERFNGRLDGIQITTHI